MCCNDIDVVGSCIRINQEDFDFMRAINIKWEDADNSDHLPEETFIPFTIRKEAIADYLASSYNGKPVSFDVDETLSIHELYEWAKLNGVEHLPLGLQFQDDGGSYPGDTFSAMPGYPITAQVEKHRGKKYVLLY